MQCMYYFVYKSGISYKLTRYIKGHMVFVSFSLTRSVLSLDSPSPSLKKTLLLLEFV